MLSKNRLKFIKSLQFKKNRLELQLFLVEGIKNVNECIQEKHFEIDSIVCTSTYAESNSSNIKNIPIEITNEKTLSEISSYKNNNAVIAIVKSRPNIPLKLNKNEIGIILDNIQDPGNLGTIIRLADWYGINKIICSNNCVELYNPKVISATMGSINRISLHYTDLDNFISSNSHPIYAAVLEGNNIHQTQIPNGSFILMGNESNGISQGLISKSDHKITIPKFGNAESLNVAMATGIILDNIRRNH